ncbi:rhomboid family intramembrane serine protease [Limibacterium fermenti]|jgi:membrane associated rhomboid family serine protease|uniref:rhomboid family intramembrane serine protease n=1 Tax=Limibacterium fermenti TaxID=3229863 RepID=UPI000E9785A6|nr:rhomboid family intramembrane serine protease [Porphyromonadaceae bacterium]HBX21664.1 rhomboid family intramembrane serine protease [Porphyromonadaceae bacterium]HBX44402.1 rhomboid family intramembrane serine protease [Porphyromonadaceae bacterium]
MITLFLIVLTAVISIAAFQDRRLVDKMIFYPPAVRQGEWYRLFSYGFLHADYAHLIFNMFTLYFFGEDIERTYRAALGASTGNLLYILMYVLGLVVSILPTYRQNRDNASYYGLGASGAVSAVVFAYILINPMNFMGILFIPVMLPAFIFGALFLVISYQLDKKQAGGINHLAHITGGVFGLVFTLLLFRWGAGIDLLNAFIARIRVDSLSDLIHFGL